jgi:hypothetical protein
MQGNLVNIAYFGGSHGAFLRFFIDKFSALTPEIKDSPFLDNGTSHNLSVTYSEKVGRYAFEDTNGNPYNNYEFKRKGEPHVLIVLDEESLMNYTRLLFTRPSDHELTSHEFICKDDGVKVSEDFQKFYRDKFLAIYDIDLISKKHVPTALIRDFMKMNFLDSTKDRSFVLSKKTLENVDANTVCINLSEIWNTQSFMTKMSEINDRFDLHLVLNDEAIALHQEFLQRRKNHNTWDRASNIIDGIKNKKNMSCLGLDLVEQGFIYAWLEKNYNYIQTPLTRNFFSDTNEIQEYVTYFPNYYKAMNPNLPTFNGIANPFYLWANRNQ